MKSPNLIAFGLLVICLLNSGCTSPRISANGGESNSNLASGSCARFKVRALEEKGGCLQLQTNPVSAELRLPTENQIPELRPLAEKWGSRAESVSYADTFRNGVEARMAIREIHGAASDTAYVLMAGLFGDSESWKYVVGAIDGAQEIWAVDLMGTGMSDCPDPRVVGPGGYSPEASAERLLQALEARLKARPEVTRLILVGCSLGGTVALRSMMDEELRARYAGVIEKVQGLVLFAPADVLVTAATEQWNAFFAINGLKAGLGNALKILQYKVVESAKDGFYQPQHCPREVAQSAIKVVAERRYREATQAMMQDAVRWRVFKKHADFEISRALEASYGNVRVPCLLVWGKCDETIPESTGYKIKDQLPDARLVVVPETDHMIFLERPRLCAQLIREFHNQLSTGNLISARTVRTIEPVTFDTESLAARVR